MEGLLIFVFIVGIPILSGWLWWRQSNALLKKFNAQFHFSVSKYVVGLEGCDRPIEKLECVVAPTDLDSGARTTRKSVRSENVTYVAGTDCHPCVRSGPKSSGGEGGIRTPLGCLA